MKSPLPLAVVLFALVMTPHVVSADMLKPGDSFPAWQMRDQTGATLSSKDVVGKTYLVWFYPRAMTPGCTAEGQGLRDHYGDFQKAAVTVLGVSFDDPKTNAEFVKQESFPFKLLSDTDRQLAAAVGAADSTDQSTARRISYLVGADGKVLKSYANVSPAAHAQQVLTDLEELRAK